jgi:hypothetical protein
MSAQILTTNYRMKESFSILGKVKETFASSLKWNATSALINNFANSIQSSFTYVKQLDKSLTDIRIVTGESR